MAKNLLYFLYVMLLSAATLNGQNNVKLLTFNGSISNQIATLKWVTVQELNNDRFEVQRSSNGLDFEFAGTLKGAGNAKRQIAYQFADDLYCYKYPEVYYRLKQIDFDGKATYSPLVKMVAEQGIASKVSVYPNPFSTSFNINFEACNAGIVAIELFDINGRTLSSAQYNSVKGSNNYLITSLLGQQPGLYFVRATLNGEVRVVKVVKED